MPLSLAVLLPLLAQIGPTGTQIPSPLEMPRRKVVAPAPLPAPAPSPSTTRLSECLNLARTRPLDAIQVAQGWRDSTKGSARIEPGQCLGMALTALERWDQATEAFAAARDDTPAHERAGRARLGTLAANAALAGGAADKALALLDAAHGEALGAGDGHLAGEIAIDRARALVALMRDNEADAALAEARHIAGQRYRLAALRDSGAAPGQAGRGPDRDRTRQRTGAARSGDRAGGRGDRGAGRARCGGAQIVAIGDRYGPRQPGGNNCTRIP